MSKDSLEPTAASVWTKEECLQVVGQCNSKEEVKKNYPEAAKAIADNRWQYMYNKKYFGKNIQEGTPEPVSATIQMVEDFIPEEHPKEEPKNIQVTEPQEILDSPLNIKATNLKKEEPTPVPIKKVRRAKVYKLTKYQPLTFTLNIGRANNLVTIDPATNTQRAIRHCPNTKSIWLDEQNNDIAVAQDITFIKGFFYVDETMAYTQDFLDVHPKNGNVFEEIDAEMDARELVEVEDLVIDIKAAIRARMREEGGIENVRAIVSVLNADVVGAAKMTPSEIRFAAYECVDNNPSRFVNDQGKITIFDDPAIKRTAIAQHAFISGKIQVSPDGKQVLWTDTRKPICAIPIGLNYLKVFSDFLNTEEGFNVAQEITKR